MSEGKKAADVASVNSVGAVAPAKIKFYDPSRESVWTRLGLNAESFKRAPGVTG